MMHFGYANLAWDQASRLLAIDSPSGYTQTVANWVQFVFEKMGFDAKFTTKGGVLVDLGGEDEADGLLLEAHADTLGAMVAQIKGNGRMKLTPLGGMNANNAEAENVDIYARNEKIISGTCQLCNASVHVNKDYDSVKRSWDTLEVVLDEEVSSAEDVRKLGIEVGDIVCFDPRTRRTSSGYLKSRFLDDKLSVGILMALAQYIRDKELLRQLVLAMEADCMEGNLTSINAYHRNDESLYYVGLDFGNIGCSLSIPSSARHTVAFLKEQGYLTYPEVEQLELAYSPKTG